jgi:hypothetical protein
VENKASDKAAGWGLAKFRYRRAFYGGISLYRLATLIDKLVAISVCDETVISL